MSGYTIEVETSVEAEVTPYDAAMAFASFDATEQVEFWVYLQQITEKWNEPACFQWEHMGEGIQKTSSETRFFLEDFATYLQGDYAAEQRFDAYSDMQVAYEKAESELEQTTLFLDDFETYLKGDDSAQRRHEALGDLRAAYAKAEPDPEVKKLIAIDPYPQIMLKYPDGLLMRVDARRGGAGVIWSWARVRRGENLREGELMLRHGEEFEWSDLDGGDHADGQ